MKKIALVGEAPHDVNAVQILLEKYFEEKHEYFPLINYIRGNELDNQKTLRLLRIEYEDKKPDIVIFIRDADAIESDADFAEKKEKRQNYFTKCKSVVDKKALLLLNIHALEALILADIDSFNRLYKTEIVFDRNPMTQSQPEVFLKKNSHYKESDSPQIFAELQVNLLIENCLYFKRFIGDLEKMLS